MPLFRRGKSDAPSWCELEFFEFLDLTPGETKRVLREGVRERLYVVSGNCTLQESSVFVELKTGDHRQIETAQQSYQILCTAGSARIVRVCGRWGQTTGPSGVFRLENGVEPANQGDPVSYPRETAFDNHYHDCDEYWIIVEGRCAAVSEERLFLLSPGDCLATGAGHHHDIPIVVKPVTGVYFEGTLEGKKRVGHLWEHRDGPASPAPGRM